MAWVVVRPYRPYEGSISTNQMIGSRMVLTGSGKEANQIATLNLVPFYLKGFPKMPN